MPGKNLLPVIVTACDIKGNDALATVYNQTAEPVPSATITFAGLKESYVASTNNVQPFELGQISFKLPNRNWQFADHKPSVVLASLPLRE